MSVKAAFETAQQDRRAFLVASTSALAALPAGRLSHAMPAPQSSSTGHGRAKSTILFFLCGGASHIDTWDMKPEAPLEYRGLFEPVGTASADIRLCEHLPLLAKQSRHLCVVQGVTDAGRATGDHHAGYYYNLTGHAPDRSFRTQGNDRRPQPDDWPFVGAVVGSRRPAHPRLPQVITLPYKPSRAPYTRPGQFAGRLGIEHDPFYLYGDPEQPLEFQAPSLSLAAGMHAGRMDDRRGLLDAINSARGKLDYDLQVRNFSRQQEKAFGLLASAATSNAFDVSQEPAALRERYGNTINATSLLMARRLVEAGVPFITVFWKGNAKLRSKCRSAGSWDTHGNNFNCLKDNLLPEFDQAYSALLSDLHERNLLDETLVVVSSEMGRKPKVGDPRSGGKSGAGRDHWTACMSVLLAGGGVQGSQVYGKTDARAEYPADEPIEPGDIAKTVYHAMGIDDLKFVDQQGRPFSLQEEGRPLLEVFG